LHVASGSVLEGCAAAASSASSLFHGCGHIPLGFSRGRRGAGGQVTMAETLEQELKRVEVEERELVLEAFDDRDALDLGLALVEKARARALPVTIDIERCGQRLFHFALPGSAPDNAAWIERKKRLVNRTFKSSYAIGLKLKTQQRTLAESMYLDEREYAAHGGCVPLVVGRVGFVGTVTVSGLAQRDDHDLVVEALREHIAGRRAG